MLAESQDPWWIIGSAAVALHGIDPGDIRDVDVVLSHADFQRCFANVRMKRELSPNPLFRSDLFARRGRQPLVIEAMAGLQVNGPTGWRPLMIGTREEIREGLYVPSRRELRAILLSFGRAKDIRRAALLH